ncbi:MAG: ParB family chromosome partitioning protein [Planctomycetota bacterium]|jgi:ParB family chromosome partitioning protein
MLTTKRYDYVPFESVQKHPMIANHRVVNQQKVAHYKTDILNNGLLEPLVVWERNPRELFLVGGFHRHGAIELIRQENAGYYDRVDVRVVTGEFEEIRALNLKLNADRLDAKLVEYFDTVIYLNNANWDKERIASFLDKSVSWIDDIIRFAPAMDSRIRSMLQDDKISWTKAKAICRRIMGCEPGQEQATAEAVIRELQEGPKPAPKRAISMRSAKTRLAKVVAANPESSYTVRAKDLLSLLTLIGDKNAPDTEEHLERVRECFPSLVDAANEQAAASHSGSSKQASEAVQSE